MAVSAEHPLAAAAAAGNPALAEFVDECSRGSTMEADVATAEKRGMHTGLHVRHPLTGEPIGIWVANYVLMSYGEGAVMGVPAHDERDFEFARRHELAMRTVVQPAGGPLRSLGAEWAPEAGRVPGLLVNSGEFIGLESAAAIDAIAAALEQRGLGAKRVQWRLRDWGISRQRYWGCPIPLIHCERCGEVPVPDEDLPVRLPEDLVPDGSGNPLAKCEAFVHCACPRCAAGRAARDRHHGHLRRFVLVFPALRQRRIRRTRRSMRARSTGCRSISTSAASSTPSCICCIRASGRA